MELDGDLVFSAATFASCQESCIEEHKPWLNAIEVKKGIEVNPAEDTSFRRVSQKARGLKSTSCSRQASPWDALKEGGDTVMFSGESTKKYLELQKLSSEVGLWIVSCRITGRI